MFLYTLIQSRVSNHTTKQFEPHLTVSWSQRRSIRNSDSVIPNVGTDLIWNQQQAVYKDRQRVSTSCVSPQGQVRMFFLWSIFLFLVKKKMYVYKSVNFVREQSDKTFFHPNWKHFFHVESSFQPLHPHLYSWQQFSISCARYSCIVATIIIIIIIFCHVMSGAL